MLVLVSRCLYENYLFAVDVEFFCPQANILNVVFHNCVFYIEKRVMLPSHCEVNEVTHGDCEVDLVGQPNKLTGEWKHNTHLHR